MIEERDEDSVRIKINTLAPNHCQSTLTFGSRHTSSPDEFEQQPYIRVLMKRVEMVTTAEHDPALPDAARYDRVSMKHATRRIIIGEPVVRAVEHPVRPLIARQLCDKSANRLLACAWPVAADILFGHLSAIRSTDARDRIAAA
jgi:hypothetical protein